MMKKIGGLWVVVGLAVLLTACGQRLQSTRVRYQEAGVMAVVKGTASGGAHVRYKTATAQGKVAVEQGRFRIAVPTTTHAQTLTMTIGSQTVKRRLKATTGLGQYHAIAQRYRQALVAESLPTRLQALLKTTTDQSRAALPAMQQAALGQALAQADRATRGLRLPTHATGLQTVLQTATSRTRLNVQAGWLMSVTVEVSPVALKQSASQRRLLLQIGALATACGADAQKLGTQLQAALQARDVSKLAQTVTDHGVRLRAGTTLTAGYLVVTRAKSD